jgi:type IV secretory pathway TraG/TraD family ATPase VirD4
MNGQFLDPRRPDFDSRSEGIAAPIISRVEGHHKFFYDSPRGILAAFTMGQILHGKPSERNLPYIASEIACRDPYKHAKWLLSVTKNSAVRARLERLASGNQEFLRSIGDFMETMKTEMTFLLNDAVARSLSAADITFLQLTQSVQTLYINAPLEQIRTFGPANKLLLGSLLGEVFQGTGGKVPLLVVMDELYQYGKDLDALPAAFAAGRKYNVVLMPCLTTWSELVSMYPKDFEVVANNLGMLQFLSVGDVAGSEHLSKLLGDVSAHASSKNLSAPADWNIPAFYSGPLEDVLTDVPSDETIAKHIKVNYTYSQVKRPLMAPFEIRQELGRDEQLVIIRSLGRPLRLRKAPYYEMPWRDRADRNPFFRK